MIRVMNLDGMFMPYPVTEIKFEKSTFPGGEVHIRLNNRVDYSDIERVMITHRINNAQHFMEIVMAKDALERKGIEHFELFIPYMPYARQDRVCNDGEAFSLKVFANMINALNFEKVFIVDPHSDKVAQLVHNCIPLDSIKYVEQAVRDIGSTKLVEIIPDKGATQRCTEIFAAVGAVTEITDGTFIGKKTNNIQFYDLIQCHKRRDPLTGKLLEFEVPDLVNFNGSPCMIVDDICDGGGTFIGLAKKLKERNAGKLYLYVTHGIFSQGLGELEKYFEIIYTTNSIQDLGSYTNVKQIKINL